MSQDPVNIGQSANDGTGDTLRVAFGKINEDIAELYNIASGGDPADILEKLLTVDGPGSGLNADLLDGFNSSAFAAAIHAHAISDVTGLQAALDAKAALVHTHAIADVTGLQAALDAKLNASSFTAAAVLTLLLTVDGSGSGLDADTLDGMSSAAFAAASHTHAQSDVTGLTAALAAKLDASAYTAADVLSKLLTVDGAGTGLDADLLDGMSSSAFALASHAHAIADVTGLQSALNAKLDASSYTAADVLTKLLTVDGAGSGLDADLLDGQSSAAFAAASHAHAISDVTGLQTALDAKLDSASYTAADVLAKLLTVDGASSGLDADLLDGMSSAAFAAASHTHAQSDITGLAASLAAKLDASAYTAADVLTKLLTVDGSGSGLDADLLDGQSSAAFALASHVHSATDITSGTLAAARLDATWPDSSSAKFGTDADLTIFHDGTDAYFRTATGSFFFGTNVTVTPANMDVVLAVNMLTERLTYISIGAANFDMTRYRTSYTAPDTPPLSHTIGSFRFRAHNGASALYTAARITAVTSEAWTAGSAQGTALQLVNTANGSASAVARLVLSGDQVQVTDGTTALAGLAFIADTDTGMFRQGTNAIGFAAGGVECMRVRLSGSTRIVSVGDGTNSASILFDGAAAGNRDFQYNTAGVGRWVLRGNSDAESGSNAGTNLQILRRDDSGNALGTALTLVRSTGQWRFEDGSAATPELSFASDTDCGLYRIGTNQIGLAVNGANVIDIGASVLALNTTTLRFNTTTATTVGAAGGASALPATPLGYLSVNVGGTAAKIPYYNT